MAGALCYAELATAYPREGGDYVYLSRAYGRSMLTLCLGPRRGRMIPRPQESAQLSDGEGEQ